MLCRMQLSVVVCTYNRAGYLRRMLQSFYEQQRLESLAFELLLVDNNSTDATATVAKEFAAQSGFRYLVEPKQGLSYARNRGLAEAAGEYIAYLDDDVLLSPEWIHRLLSCFEETDADVVGGRSLLKFEVPPPTWFGSELGKLVSQVELGDRRMDAGDGRRLYGLNVAYRTERLRCVGGFDTTLGRTGKKLLSGEDLRANAAVVAAGGKAFYEPEALVHHCIPPERIEWEYLLKLSEAGARTRARLDWDRGPQFALAGFCIALAKLVQATLMRAFVIRRDMNSERYRAYLIARHRLARLLVYYTRLT